MRSRLLKFWNFWPPFLGTGIRIAQVSKDFRYVRSELRFSFWNANIVGVQFGGSIFAMTDPFYMVMLMQNIGHEYIVWDKAASIRYLKPGKSKLHAEFKITEQDLVDIREQVAKLEKYDWKRTVQVFDENQQVIAEIDKVVYIRRKRPKA